MSAEILQLKDNEKIYDSNIKPDFIKIYHQSGANVDAENSQIKFYFGENRNFIQVCNGYLKFDIRVRRADGIASTMVAPGNDKFRLVDNAFT